MEGGLRTTSFVSGGAVEWANHGDYDKLFHISDWHDTILDATHCKHNRKSSSSPLVSVSQWDKLTNQGMTTPRSVLLHNIDERNRANGEERRQWVKELASMYNVNLHAQSALQYNGWKLITGDPMFGQTSGVPHLPPEIDNLKTEPARFDYRESCFLDINYHNMSARSELDRLVQLYDLRNDPGINEDFP